LELNEEKKKDNIFVKSAAEYVMDCIGGIYSYIISPSSLLGHTALVLLSSQLDHSPTALTAAQTKRSREISLEKYSAVSRLV